MDSKTATVSSSGKILSWVVGLIVLAFFVALAFSMASVTLTPAFLLWTDASMVIAAAAGLLLFIITRIVGRYST